MPRRGCGYRIAGGVYATWGVAGDPEEQQPQPTELFVLGAPIVIDPVALGVSPLGVTMIERNGVWHLIDWIGELHYATVADFVVEARFQGVSRRVPANLDFSRFTPESRILCVHRHAGGEDVPAIFASFPIQAWQVVRDPIAQRHVAPLSRMVNQTRLPLEQGERSARQIVVSLVEE
jgi:hypothetical protein